MKKRALITGVNGQDGALLAKLLCEKNYEVFGGCRNTSDSSTWRLVDVGVSDSPNFNLRRMDVNEYESCLSVINEIEPDEIYNLAAQSSVIESFRNPHQTSQVNVLGCMNLLEGIRALNPEIKFFQPGSSEIFGGSNGQLSHEGSDFNPKSPYGFSKMLAYFEVLNYRKNFDIFATNGILFNHESSLRAPDFVSRKISIAVARIAQGSQEVLQLGSLESSRDWGYAPEYVHGIWQMLQHDEPDDFILATGESKSVREFAINCFSQIGVDLEFQGEGPDEVGLCSATGRRLVDVNPAFIRKTDPLVVVGDASKARRVLGWVATSGLSDIAREMVGFDLRRLSSNKS